MGHNTDKMLNTTVEDLHPNFVTLNEKETTSIRKSADPNALKLTQKRQINVEAISKTERKHLTLYQKIFDYYAFLGLFFGVTCRYEWKVYGNVFFWLTNFLVFISNFCSVYTGCIYYLRGDLIKILEPFAISGISFTCMVKWYFYTKYLHNVLALMFAVKRICEEISSGERVNTIIKSLQRTHSVLRAFAAALIGVVVFFVAVPLKFFVVDRIYYPLLPILIPFFEENTLRDHLASAAIQSLMGVYAGVSTLTFGSGFLVIIYNYGLQVNLIELDFKDLNDMWSPSSDIPIAIRHAFLNNIAVKLQDMQRYMKEVKSIYEIKFFIFFLISYFGQAVCLYQITERDWLPGYTALFIVFIEMMFYCMVGTQITTLGDRMCDFIQRTDWYIFDIHSQRTLRFILEQCQLPCRISLLSFGTLNMVTSVSMIKGIYCYYTVMTEVL